MTQQELVGYMSKIDQLHTENKALKTRIAELENEVKALEISLKRSNRLSKQRRDIIYMMSKNNKDTLKVGLQSLS